MKWSKISRNRPQKQNSPVEIRTPGEPLHLQGQASTVAGPLRPARLLLSGKRGAQVLLHGVTLGLQQLQGAFPRAERDVEVGFFLLPLKWRVNFWLAAEAQQG